MISIALYLVHGLNLVEERKWFSVLTFIFLAVFGGKNPIFSATKQRWLFATGFCQCISLFYFWEIKPIFVFPFFLF
jgi:hypothetical protein